MEIDNASEGKMTLRTCKLLRAAFLAVLLALPAVAGAQQPGFYVSFSGESSKTSQPITNVYALSADGKTLSTAVLDPGQSYLELRGMAFGPDGKLYVCQAQKSHSAILQFSATTSSGGYTHSYLGQYATPQSSSGLVHPYQPAFDSIGNLYVTSQDTNVVTAFQGPTGSQPGSAMPNSPFLQQSYSSGTFNPGTFVAAQSAAKGVPKFTPVPTSQGGLTFALSGSSTHSVRGLAFDDKGHLFVADEGSNRIGVYDATSGAFLGAITQSGNEAINDPVALFFNAANHTLYIGSPGNKRLFTYDVKNVAKGDFKANVLIKDSKLDKLSGIAVDAGGNIYTCSRKSNKIYKWSPDGKSSSDFAGPFSDNPEQIIVIANVGG
jgi:NHL repeat